VRLQQVTEFDLDVSSFMAVMTVGTCRDLQCVSLINRVFIATYSEVRKTMGIPPGAWMFFCCVCCVLSGRGLCDELITCPEESYRLRRVVVCDQETS
jgi:hypothetical protein